MRRTKSRTPSRFAALSWLAVGGALALALGPSCKPQIEPEAPIVVTSTPTSAQDPEEVAPPKSVEEILASSDLPPTLEAPLAGDEMGVTIHRLSNGMTVYISTDRQKPRITTWIGTRAGSRHDPADSTGLAHYLEHMLFKGTDDFGTLDPEAEAPHVRRVRELYTELRGTEDDARRKQIFAEIDAETQKQAEYAVPNEFDRMYSMLGVQGTNAFTSDEETVYIGDIPSNRLMQWAVVESERFADPVFRLFYPELEAVYEEKNLSMDRPGSRVFETLHLALYPEHPYGTQPTIGVAEHLKTPAYQDMVDYFERWYVPNNMAIVLAGDIDADTALPVLEKLFSRLTPKPLPSELPGKVVPLAGRVVREVRAEGEESTRLAWLTVPVAHEDQAALDVLDLVLDDARVGLLNVELELTQTVPSAGSWHSAMRESGYFAVWARAREGQSPEALEALILEVVHKLRDGEFTEADVEAAKLSESVARKQRLEYPFSRASSMMDSFVQHRPWADVVAADDAFDAVTRADVVIAANKYLDGNYVVVHRRKGKAEVTKIDKPEITPVEIDPSRNSDFAQRVLAMPTPSLEPQWVVEGEHYEHRTLPAGRLITAKNPRNDLFSLSYAMDRGYRKEPLLCYALDLFEISGAKGKTAEQVQKELYALGSDVSTSCHAEGASIEVSGVDGRLEETLVILDRWIESPAFDQAMLDRHLRNTLSDRKDQLEEDWSLTSALDLYAKYGSRSAWLQHPSNKALAKASKRQLTRLITTFFDHEHRTMYFGPRSADAAAKVVARGSGKKKVGPRWTRKYRTIKGPQIYFLHKEEAKANVRFVMPRAPLPRAQRPLAKLFSEYLSGNMSSLVFQEIRESRGLAYSAYSQFDWGSRPADMSGLLGFMSTQADKVPVAVQTFLGLLRDDEIAAERVAAALEAIDQEYRATRIDPRWVTLWVRSWDELGEKEDPRPWEWAQVSKLGVQDTQRFAKQFATTPVIIAIVGDRERVGLAELEKIGPVTEVKAEALFSYGPDPEPKKPTKKPREVDDHKRKIKSKRPTG